jgi:TRAP-type C4-dicarboxylate transport system permease small subunit
VARVLEGAQEAVDRASAALLALCSGATIVLVAGIAAVVAASVFWRYVLNDALSWAEELAKYSMVWLTFTGAPVALARGAHIAIELLPSSLPDRARQAVMLVVSVIVVGLLAVLLHYGVVFTWNGRRQVMIMLGGFSMAWLFAAVPFGAAVMLVVASGQMLRHLRGLLDPRAVRGEEAAATATGSAGSA